MQLNYAELDASDCVLLFDVIRIFSMPFNLAPFINLQRSSHQSFPFYELIISVASTRN